MPVTITLLYIQIAALWTILIAALAAIIAVRLPTGYIRFILDDAPGQPLVHRDTTTQNQSVPRTRDLFSVHDRARIALVRNAVVTIVASLALLIFCGAVYYQHHFVLYTPNALWLTTGLTAAITALIHEQLRSLLTYRRHALTHSAFPSANHPSEVETTRPIRRVPATADPAEALTVPMQRVTTGPESGNTTQ